MKKTGAIAIETILLGLMALGVLTVLFFLILHPFDSLKKISSFLSSAKEELLGSGELDVTIKDAYKINTDDSVLVIVRNPVTSFQFTLKNELDSPIENANVEVESKEHSSCNSFLGQGDVSLIRLEKINVDAYGERKFSYDDFRNFCDDTTKFEITVSNKNKKNKFCVICKDPNSLLPNIGTDIKCDEPVTSGC